MKVESSDESKIRLCFEDDGELGVFVEKLRQETGFVVLLERPLRLYERSLIQLEVESVARGSFEAEVAQIFPGADSGAGQQTAFLVDPSSLQLKPAVSTGGKGTAGETFGASPIHQIKEMNVSQKARLATRAGRSERQILLRDNSPQVLQSLLVNPRLEAKDVLRIVKSNHANGAILQRVAGDARWGKNQEVLAAVTKNPKTPSPVAIRLVERLRISDLRVMAKMSSGLKDHIRRAALREYLRRSGR